MQIKIKCPNKDCGKTLVVDSEMAGKKGKCSTCDSIFLIPGTPSPTSPAGGSTVNLASAGSGELSSEKKATRSQGAGKRRPGSRSGETKRSGDKYLDDYIEGAKPKRARAAREESADDSADSVDYVEYDDYEETSPRRGRSARRDKEDYVDDYDDAPRRRGRRREDDYYEEDPYYEDDYYEDPYEDGYGAPVRGASRGRRKRSGPNIALIRAGFMVMAIAGFVFCGAVAIKILVELIWILSSRVGDTSGTFWKIAEMIWLGASVAVIVGYSFLLFFPNKNSSRGLTIAALSVGSINIIVQLVFKIIPMFSDGIGFLGLGLGGFGRGSAVEAMLKVGLMEGLFIAEIVLVAVAFVAINKQLKDRYNLQMAKQMIIPAGIYGGVLVVMGMFGLILTESPPKSETAATIWKWVLYLMRVTSQGMLLWYFINYVMLMFNTRNAMPKS